MSVIRRIPHEHYTKMLRRAEPERLSWILTASNTELETLGTWLAKSDKQAPDEVFVFLQADGSPVPRHIQRLWGSHYFTAWQTIVERWNQEMALRYYFDTLGDATSSEAVA